MRCVLALMAMTAALSAQSAHPAQTIKLKPKSTAPPAAKTGSKSVASTKSANSQTAANKSNLKSVTPKAHLTASRRLVNGRWVTTSHRAARPSRLAGQQHPEQNRYQDIQKALQERGYFKGQPTGEWKDDSTDALKRFQADQKLPNDGKINSLTLIGLGLGPKHDGGPLTPPPPSGLPPATPPPISPETIPPPNTSQ
jgi:hypothetical protein